jgi:hypothetical protein
MPERTAGFVAPGKWRNRSRVPPYAGYCLPLEKIAHSVWRINIQGEKYGTGWPFNPPHPPTHAAFPARLRAQYPVASCFRNHKILDQALMFHPKGQIVSIELSEKRDLFLC